MAADESPASRLGYRPALDGLRAVACLMVMLFHAFWPTSTGGFLGVDIFFVLSGFLITTLLVQEYRAGQTIHLPRFYLRRILRLMPALVFMVLLFSAWMRPLERLAALTYTWNVLIVTGIGDSLRISPWVHLWSLAAEEQFYLLWPLVLWLLLRKAGRTIAVRILIGSILAITLWRAGLYAAFHSWDRVYFGPDTRSDGLLIGCLLALILAAPSGRGWVQRYAVNRWARNVALVLLIALPLTFVYGASFYAYGGFTLFALAASVVIANLLSENPWPLRRGLEARPMVFIGKLSYALYLWHLPISARMELYGLDTGTPLGLTLFFLLSFLAALISYRYIEHPISKLSGSRLLQSGGHRRTARAPVTTHTTTMSGPD